MSRDTSHSILHVSKLEPSEYIKLKVAIFLVEPLLGSEPHRTWDSLVASLCNVDLIVFSSNQGGNVLFFDFLKMDSFPKKR